MVPVGLSRGWSESLRHAKGYKKMGGGMLERELRGHAVGRENAGVGRVSVTRRWNAPPKGCPRRSLYRLLLPRSFPFPRLPDGSAGRPEPPDCTRAGRKTAVALCTGTALVLCAASAAADCGPLDALIDEFARVGEAHEILKRAAHHGPIGETAAASVLVAEFDRLIEQRTCYLDRIVEARTLAAAGAGKPADLLPTLREQRDALSAFMNRLPKDFTAGHDMLRTTIQSLNLGINTARERDGETVRSEAIAELLLHAEVVAQTAFVQVEVARARLREEVLGRRVGEEARAALDALKDFVPRALAFNALVVGNSRLTRRFSADAAPGGVVVAHGEYALRGAPFDREIHCRLAWFKASEALDALASRMGVVGRGETRAGCENRGDTVTARLSVPQENLIFFRRPR